MSNFVKNRGFLDPNRLLHAPQFSNVVSQPSTLSRPIQRINQGGEGSNLSKSLINNMARMDEHSGTQVLWGTTINTSALQNNLKEFLTTFTAIPENDDDQNFNIEPYYITLLKQLAITEELVLDINCDHLIEFNRSLYR